MLTKNKKIIFGVRNGFTLLELMIVIGTIGIMTGIGFASFGSAKRHSALRAGQYEVTSAIKLAQSYALQGKSVSGVTKICGYGFKFDLPSNPGDPIIDYEIFYYTAGLDCAGAKTENPIETQKLNGGIKLSFPSDLSETTIYFSIPSATLTSKNGGFSKTLRFSLGGDEKSITIDSVGRITEN